MEFFDRLFGGANFAEAPDPTAIVWGKTPPIYEFLRSHIDQENPGLGAAGYQLPDENHHEPESKIRFAPGAFDGIPIHHARAKSDANSALTTLKLLSRYCRHPTIKNAQAVYDNVVANPIRPRLGQLFNEVRESKELWGQPLHELAHSFATRGSDREPVIFGIILLALFNEPRTEALLQTLGRHDEFTVYCAISLRTNSQNLEQSLWTLARNVNGWGRIHTVERLAETEDPEIKDWLLRDGFRSSVGYEYLAAICARSGGLRAALSQTQTDRELLTAAGEIIRALIAGGPADGIDEYEDAPSVIESYLGLMAAQAETIGDCLTVQDIEGFLNQDDIHWAERCNRNWTIDRRDRLRNACHSILGLPHWQAHIRTALASEGQLEFFQANKAAKTHGLDTWNVYWKRLLEKPTEPFRWYEVMDLCNENRIDSVLEIACSRLDLKGIATGAANELGLGEGFTEHACLDYILQDLRRFPGRGARLIETGLKSPVVRNRNMAIAALEQWPHASWSTELEREVTLAYAVEPVFGVRDRLQKLLKGEDLDP